MDFNVEQLMARIQESAAQRKLAAGPPAGPFKLSQLNPRPNINFELPEIKLSPEFKTRRDNHYHVNDLLQFHDRDFVRNAYRAILKREPDEAGWNSYLDRLRSGRRNKIDILASLRFSAEGRQRNVTVDGLKIPALFRGLTRVPVVGYVCEWAIGLLRLPTSIHNHRRFEGHVIAQQQLVTDHVNRLTGTVRSLEQFVAQLSPLQEALTDAQEQLRLQESRLLEHDKTLIDFSQQAEALRNRYDGLYDGLNEELKAQLLDNQSKFAAHSEALDHLQQSYRHLQQGYQHLQQSYQHLQQSYREVKAEVSAQQARVASAVRTTGQREASETKTDFAAALQYGNESLDSLFVSLEDRFRGQRQEIKDRFRSYLPYFEQNNIKTNILDLGCGRGEWLELLKEMGLNAQGVDSNRLMIEQCQASDLSVVHGNALEHLRGVPDSSLDGITAFHVIEHLQFAELIELFDQSIRTLRSGGLLILETPNPENVIVATRNFYLDPSHRRPLPSELVEFLLSARGFINIEVVNLHPLMAGRVSGETELSHRINDLFYGPMDYGIIARRI